MPNYRAMARRTARRYGLDPDIFEAQIQAESGFRPGARSNMGAQGIAQIIPSTARAWGVDPNNPRQALNAAGKHMAQYVRKYGSYENALRAYNAGPGRIEESKGFSETNAYVAKILGGKSGRPTGAEGGGGGKATVSSPGTAVNVAAALASQSEKPAVSTTAPALPEALTPKGFTPVQSRAPAQEEPELKGALERLSDLEDSLPTVKQSEGSYALGGSGKANVSPGGGFGGTTRPVIELAKIGHALGLQTTSGKRGTVNTASGGVSDHYRGNTNANARDLGGSVENMDRAAVKIAKTLGIKGYKRGRPLVATVNRNGIRYQVLYRTNTGGDHFDHIHVGAKRI